MAPTITITVPLPDYHGWMGSDAWKAHLLDYENHERSDCPSCQVSPMTAAIHKAIFSDTLSREDSNRAAVLAWKLQDGFGPGSSNEVGWDWSGIRDSSPAATKDMYDLLVEEGLI